MWDIARRVIAPACIRTASILILHWAVSTSKSEDGRKDQMKRNSPHLPLR